MRLNGKKFKRARRDKGFTHREIAEKIGRSESSISSWENGTRTCAPKLIRRLAEVLGVEVRDIANTREDYIDGGAADAYQVNEVADLYRTVPVPIISFAQAAGFDPVLEPFEEYVKGCSGEEALFAAAKDNYFALRVEGDSMSPEYPNGTVLLVAGGEYPRRGDTVVAKIRETGQVVVKNYSRRNNVIRLESINPSGRNFEWDCKENPGYLQWMWPVLQATIDLRARRWEQVRQGTAPAI